jgi:hypothetical protein
MRRCSPPSHHDERHDDSSGRSGEAHNRFAGQGAVLLDIGGSVGALVLHMPDRMIGSEIEMCPAGEDHGAAHRPHVAVLPRPSRAGMVPTAVFPAVEQGRYELYRKSDGPTELTVDVTGGQVVEAVWPSG